MTIATPATPLSYNGDDSTTAFSITWMYFVKSNVVATLRDSAGAETVWVLGTNYTLSDAGVSTGGTLTAITIPATNETLVITLEPPNIQSTNIPVGGSFPASSVEDSLDIASQRDAKMQEILDRTLRAPKSDTRSGSQLEMPNETTRASKFLTFDVNGDPGTSAGTGADNGLRADLASTTNTEGASLIGIEDSAGVITATTVEAALAELAPLDGTWTPVLSDGTNNATPSTAVGVYTKIGNQVSIKCYLATSSLGSVSGDIRITGLPFTSENLANSQCGISVSYAAGLNITAGESLGGYIPTDSTYIVLSVWNTTAGVANMTSTEWSADGEVMLTATYFV